MPAAHSMESSRATSLSKAPTPQLSPRTATRMQELANRVVGTSWDQFEGSKTSLDIGAGNGSPDLKTDEGNPLSAHGLLPLDLLLGKVFSDIKCLLQQVVVVGGVGVNTSSVVNCASVVQLRKSADFRTCRPACAFELTLYTLVHPSRSALLFQLRFESFL